MIFKILAITIITFSANAGVFNTVEFSSANLKSIPKWTNVINKAITNDNEHIACLNLDDKCADEKYLQWAKFIEELKNITDTKVALNKVNNFFNQWQYTLDIDLWGVNDYWEIPKEFLELSGDCEDYAIIKYYTLKKAGFDINNMRIVILQDIVRNGAHAVLVVQSNNENLVLDNLSSQILPDTLLKQYKPYYSVNETTRWVHFKKI